jgi:colanic acid/amylovoran biosynthesis glycosyltransferase
MFANYSSSNEVAVRNDVNIEKTRFIFVGRVTEEKGILDCLRAFSILLAEDPALPISMKVCGDGPLLSSIKSEFDWMVRQGVLDYYGHIEGGDLRDAYTSSDILLLPTRYPEGFPYVLIEAYQNGLCVIARPEGALAEHVVDGKTGYLLREEGAEYLAQCMLQLVNDRELLRKLQSDAREYFSRNFRYQLGFDFYERLMSPAPISPTRPDAALSG